MTGVYSMTGLMTDVYTFKRSFSLNPFFIIQFYLLGYDRKQRGTLQGDEAEANRPVREKPNKGP